MLCKTFLFLSPSSSREYLSRAQYLYREAEAAHLTTSNLFQSMSKTLSSEQMIPSLVKETLLSPSSTGSTTSARSARQSMSAASRRSLSNPRYRPWCGIMSRQESSRSSSRTMHSWERIRRPARSSRMRYGNSILIHFMTSTRRCSPHKPKRTAASATKYPSLSSSVLYPASTRTVSNNRSPQNATNILRSWPKTKKKALLSVSMALRASLRARRSFPAPTIWTPLYQPLTLNSENRAEDWWLDARLRKKRAHDCSENQDYQLTTTRQGLGGKCRNYFLPRTCRKDSGGIRAVA